MSTLLDWDDRRFFLAASRSGSLAGADLPRRDLWLAIHEDLRTSPRVRAVADYCAEVVRRVVGPPQ